MFRHLIPALADRLKSCHSPAAFGERTNAAYRADQLA